MGWFSHNDSDDSKNKEGEEGGAPEFHWWNPFSWFGGGGHQQTGYETFLRWVEEHTRNGRVLSQGEFVYARGEWQRFSSVEHYAMASSQRIPETLRSALDRNDYASYKEYADAGVQ